MAILASDPVDELLVLLLCPQGSRIGMLRYRNEMIDSFTLSHEAVTNLNTDSMAQREQSCGSPRVIPRENKEEQLRQNCGTNGQRDVVLVSVICEQSKWSLNYNENFKRKKREKRTKRFMFAWSTVYSMFLD